MKTDQELLDLYEHLLPRDAIVNFAASVRKHICYVQEAGQKIGVPVQQLSVHDWSKWTPEEFPFYARNFFGDRGDPNGFALAWLTHLQRQPHHPEHWRYPGEYDDIKNANIVKGCLPMPTHYILEHVADMMGASMVYQGTWDMGPWLARNMHRKFYHPETAAAMREILSDLGYVTIVRQYKFGGEE